MYDSVRPGRNEKLFKIYKFRTMTNQYDEYGELLPDKMRLTKFGKLLRATSIDELPALLNILKGDMSIIGPRPLLMEYLEIYPERYKVRHAVRPGLELPPPNGRSYFLTWREQFEQDVWYVENVSFLVDLKMLINIIKMVLNIKHNDVRVNATRPMFDGTNIDDSLEEHIKSSHQ